MFWAHQIANSLTIREKEGGRGGGWLQGNRLEFGSLSINMLREMTSLVAYAEYICHQKI